jgi:hypothetical protein
LPRKANDNTESLNIKVNPAVNVILNDAKTEGIDSKSGFLLEALTLYKWFNNHASYRLTKENVRSRELLKAIRVDMVQKKANSAELLKIDDALQAVNDILARFEKDGDGKL